MHNLAYPCEYYHYHHSADSMTSAQDAHPVVILADRVEKRGRQLSKRSDSDTVRQLDFPALNKVFTHSGCALKIWARQVSVCDRLLAQIPGLFVIMQNVL